MVLARQDKPMQIDARLTRLEDRGLFAVRFKALGSACSFQFAAASQEKANAFVRASIGWIAGFEMKYSRFRDDSLLSRINRSAGREWVEVDEEAEALFALCDELSFMTQGLLDPTSLPLIQLWDYRRMPREMPTDDEVESARSLVGWSKVERKPGSVFLPKEGMSLDFGGFGKEYAVDQVISIARSHGLPCCLVDLGRDVRAYGAPPGLPAWHIGLEDPSAPGSTWSGLALVDCGLASSGDYRRFFEYQGNRYGHIVDPRTGRPVSNETLSVTVVSNSCLEAGILTTSAFVLGQPDGIDLVESTLGSEGCLVLKDGIYQSSGFSQFLTQ